MLDTGKCPAPVSEQDRACILHDLVLRTNNVKFWQLWNPNVSEIHLDLAANSPYIGFKILFGLMSLPGLPARVVRDIFNQVKYQIP
jgi:hypothetical protein